MLVGASLLANGINELRIIREQARSYSVMYEYLKYVQAVVKYYVIFLRLVTPSKLSNPEPNIQTAAGMGTADIVPSRCNV